MTSLVLVAVAIGALAQRVTGMGFALVVAPALVILLGPFDGVLIVNFCGVVSSLLVFARVWRRVDWSILWWLALPAVIAIVPGSWVAANLAGPVLQMGVGVLILIALSISLLVTRREATVPRRPAAVITGLASGFMNTTAGVGGPALSVYAVLTRWPQVTFAATAQPYFALLGITSLISKFAFSGGAWPALTALDWILILLALLTGLVVGDLLVHRISTDSARLAVIVIAYLGGIAAIADGVLHL